MLYTTQEDNFCQSCLFELCADTDLETYTCKYGGFLFQKGGACIMLKKITFLYENDKKSVIYGIILSNVKLYLTKFKAVLGR